ncbi:MAG: CRTAC1 family protein [Verrucomicrobiales bacterium]|nr:CRTAC1 family protein [Verrucomicrobiales bacterium]
MSSNSCADRCGRVAGPASGLKQVGWGADRVLVLVLALGLSLTMGRREASAQDASRAADVARLLAEDPLCAPGVPTALSALPPGTRRMVARLEAVRRKMEASPQHGAFQSGLLAEYYRRALREAIQGGDLKRVFQLRPRLGIQLLNSGENQAALDVFEEFEISAQEVLGARMSSRDQAQLGLLKALCYLRMGEFENCLSHPTTESCLLPIQGSGVHRLRRGSEGAVQVLTNHLNRFSSDLEARWLLNIAAMTLGQHPHGVPAQWLIPPAAFASDHDIKKFPDIAGVVGLDVNDLAGGSLTEDFDNDGDLDIVASSWGLTGTLRLFRNNGDGTFREMTEEAGLTGLVGGLHLMQTDYDNDGFADIWVLRGAWLGAAGRHPNSLLRNRGDGTFEDVTEQARLLSFHPTQTSAWFDFDGDGWLDVFIGNESEAKDPHPCELYRNNRDGTFTECAAEVGVAVRGYIKGVVAGDFNNDGRPDLYLSNRDGANVLFRNDGPSAAPGSGAFGWKFVDVTATAGVAEPMRSFPTWFWDYDQDGWLDIMVTGYSIRGVGDIASDVLGLPHKAERARLYRNRGDGTFEDVTVRVGLFKVLHAMGANFGDLDNDGWVDFYVGTGDPDLATLIPNRMFRNDGGQRFQDVTTSGGFGHLQKGHGVSFADLDNDGDQDVHVVMGGAYSGDPYRNCLFQNPGHGNHWLKLKLEGVRANRAAIGARVRVTLVTPDGLRSLHHVVGSGASFGANPLRLEIGLGQATSIREVEVRWPGSNSTSVYRDLEMDRGYRLQEGAAAVTALPLHPFVMPAPGAMARSHPTAHHLPGQASSHSTSDGRKDGAR